MHVYWGGGGGGLSLITDLMYIVFGSNSHVFNYNIFNFFEIYFISHGCDVARCTLLFAVYAIPGVLYSLVHCVFFAY